MKHQIVIHDSPPGTWKKCKDVSFANEVASWELASSHYDLFEAYKKEPHRELIDATDDASLRSFIKDWGPLRDSLSQETIGRDPIAQYRIIRAQFSWKATLLLSIGHPQRQRDVLASFDQVQKLRFDMIRGLGQPAKKEALARLAWGTLESHFQGVVDASLVILPGSPPWDDANEILDESIPSAWLEKATAKEIEEVCIRLVNNLKISHVPAYHVVQRKNGSSIQAKFALPSLLAALDWMIWQDIYNERPFLRCEECEHLITIATRHPKRFCSDQCARRKTTRLWQQRKREEARAANGTKKTR